MSKTNEPWLIEINRDGWDGARKVMRRKETARQKYVVRNDMRLWAYDYAELRGWSVALTPPQRQKGSKRG